MSPRHILESNPLAIGADRTCGACPTARPPTATFLLQKLEYRGIPTLIHILGECHAGGATISSSGKVPHRASTARRGHVAKACRRWDPLQRNGGHAGCTREGISLT